MHGCDEIRCQGAGYAGLGADKKLLAIGSNADKSALGSEPYEIIILENGEDKGRIRNAGKVVGMKVLLDGHQLHESVHIAAYPEHTAAHVVGMQRHDAVG